MKYSFSFFSTATICIAVVSAIPQHAAACDGKSLLKCNSVDGSVDVCMDNHIVYADLSFKETKLKKLSAEIAKALIIPWEGFGRYRINVLILERNEVKFEIFSSFDTRGGDGFWKSGFNVIRSGSVTEQIMCDSREREDWLDPVYSAKTAIGQCWDRESESWQVACD